MRLRTLMHAVATVSVVVILATPIARAYVHGGKTPQSIQGPSTPRTATTEEARVLPFESSILDDKPLPRAARSPISEPGTLITFSLGLLALGAAARKRRGLDASPPLARLQVVP